MTEFERILWIVLASDLIILGLLLMGYGIKQLIDQRRYDR